MGFHLCYACGCYVWFSLEHDSDPASGTDQLLLGRLELTLTEMVGLGWAKTLSVQYFITFFIHISVSKDYNSYTISRIIQINVLDIINTLWAIFDALLLDNFLILSIRDRLKTQINLFKSK